MLKMTTNRKNTEELISDFKSIKTPKAKNKKNIKKEV